MSHASIDQSQLYGWAQLECWGRITWESLSIAAASCSWRKLSHKLNVIIKPLDRWRTLLFFTPLQLISWLIIPCRSIVIALHYFDRFLIILKILNSKCGLNTHKKSSFFMEYWKSRSSSYKKWVKCHMKSVKTRLEKRRLLLFNRWNVK